MINESRRSTKPAQAGGANESHRPAVISMLERLRANTTLVRNAEQRLINQGLLIERLQAADRSTASAEESLEAMRNVLGDLYHERTILRRCMPTENAQRAASGRGGGPQRAKAKQKSKS